MKKIIIFLGLLVILSSFASATYSTDRTDYYYNSSNGYYLTDGIEDTDIAINGSSPSNGELLLDYGWHLSYVGTPGTASYSNAEVYKGSLSAKLTPAGGGTGVYIRLTLSNSSFKGKVGLTLMRTGIFYGLVKMVDTDGIMQGGTYMGGDWTPIDKDGNYACDVDGYVSGEWKNFTYDFTSGTDIVLYQNDAFCYNFTGQAVTGIGYVEIFLHDAYNLYMDDFWISNGDRPEEGEDNTPPALLNVNCTSCTEDSTPDQEPFETEDTTPTFKLDTNEPASCRIHSTDVSYATMGASRNCTGEGTEGPHTCTLNVPDRFNTVGQNNIYISCIDGSSNENKTGLLMEIKGASEEHGDDAIELGITTSEIGGTATIYSSQQVSARNLATNQFTGTFDKVAVNGNKRWAFNYVSLGESPITGLFNLTTVLYVLQLQNQTNETIIDEVGKLINSTWP